MKRVLPAQHCRRAVWLRVRHNDYQGINAIAFSSADPRAMYLGLEKER